MTLHEPGPNGSSGDLWNVPVNADDDGRDSTRTNQL